MFVWNFATLFFLTAQSFVTLRNYVNGFGSFKSVTYYSPVYTPGEFTTAFNDIALSCFVV